MQIAEFIYTTLLKPPLLRRVANFCLRAIVPETVRVGRAKVCLNPQDPVISGALTLGVYEREEIAFFRKWFEEGMTFIDVGANVGLYTALALAEFPRRTRVLCLEPDVESFRFLQGTIRSNQLEENQSSVLALNLAASEVVEDTILYKNSSNKGDNRIYPDPQCLDCQPTSSRPLDIICREQKIEQVNFIKIDVQGAEARVIQGAQSLLQSSPDCILLTEFWPHGLARCGSNALNYLEDIQRLGFTIHELVGQKLSVVRDFARMIEMTPGRKYRNLVCLKGQFLNRVKG